MARKRNRDADAALYLPFMTNGMVDDLQAAGYLPIIQWMRKEDYGKKRRKLVSTDEAWNTMRKARPRQSVAKGSE